MKQHIKNPPFPICLDTWRLALYLLFTLCGFMYSEAIMGGYRATIYDFPFVVSVYDVQYRAHRCGGSLLTPRHALTVAHHFRVFGHTLMDPKQFKIVAGATFLGSLYIDEWSWGHNLQMRQVKRILIHPDYEPFHNNLPNDLAILTVTHDFYMSSAVQVSRLPTSITTVNAYVDQNITVAGYGFLNKRRQTKYLHAIDVEIFDVDECIKMLKENNMVVLRDQNMCAREKKQPRGKSFCYGDEGSPGLIDGTQVAWLFWNTCARTGPGFFSRLDIFVEWIKNHTSMTAEY